MRSSVLSRRILQGVLLLFIPPTVMAGGILALLYTLEVHHHPAAWWSALALGSAVMVTYLAFMIHGMGESLAATVREMQLGTELMATVHPAHRLQVQTGDEFESLAAGINRLADLLATARQGAEAATAGATEGLAAERDLLARTLERLGAGVVVLSGEDRISLANPAAHLLLDPRGPALVGRRLADLLSKEEAARLHDRMQLDRAPAKSMVVQLASGQHLHAVLTLLGSVERLEPSCVLLLLPDSPIVGPEPRGAHPADGSGAGESEGTIGHRKGMVGAGTRSGTSRGVSRQPPPLCDVGWLERAARLECPADRDQPLDELEGVVIDAETTGLDRDGQDRIVSLAGVRLRGDRVLRGQVFDTIINPRRSIPAASTTLHGLTDRQVADAPPAEEILPAFFDFVRGAALVGHQVWFDLHFLAREAERVGLPGLDPGQAILDIQLLARLVESRWGDLGLEGIADWLGVTVDGRHSALGDAFITAEIYVRLLPLLRQRGIVTLGHACTAVTSL